MPLSITFIVHVQSISVRASVFFFSKTSDILCPPDAVIPDPVHLGHSQREAQHLALLLNSLYTTQYHWSHFCVAQYFPFILPNRMSVFLFVLLVTQTNNNPRSLIIQSKIAAIVLNGAAGADSVILPTTTGCFMRLRHFHVLAVKPSALVSGCKPMPFCSVALTVRQAPTILKWSLVLNQKHLTCTLSTQTSMGSSFFGPFFKEGCILYCKLMYTLHTMKLFLCSE